MIRKTRPKKKQINRRTKFSFASFFSLIITVVLCIRLLDKLSAVRFILFYIYFFCRFVVRRQIGGKRKKHTHTYGVDKKTTAQAMFFS